MEQANKRIKVLEHELKKLAVQKAEDSDSDDDDDLNDKEGLETEKKELEAANAARKAKLDEYEKNKKWNVDNMFEVKEERSIVNPSAGKLGYTKTGFVTSDATPSESKLKKAMDEKKKTASSKDTKPAAAKKPVAGPSPPPASAMSADEQKALESKTYSDEDMGVMMTYHEFTEKHADTVEEFMAKEE